jgi:hypothetical protein
VERLYGWHCSARGARAGRSPPKRDQHMPQVFGALARRCRLVTCTAVVLNQMAVRITPGPARSWQKSNGLLPGFGASRRNKLTKNGSFPLTCLSLTNLNRSVWMD